MKWKKSERMGRLAGEFTVIVVGVLVALAADRWNQTRDAQAQAADFTDRLEAELIADSVRLEDHRQALQAQVPDGLALLDIVRGTAPDTTARSLQFACSGGTAPHKGGATFSEIQSVGSLGLLAPAIRQTLFDYYGYADGIQRRIEDIRLRDRHALRLAADRSGAWMPVDVVPRAEFTERLRDYPDIEGIVMGCIALLLGERAIVGQWSNRLAETLAVVREVELDAHTR